MLCQQTKKDQGRCHSGFNFTDEKFHNLGIDADADHGDLGRYKVTRNPENIGAFKNPPVREIAHTAPYMHDGRFETLREVVEFYSQGGIKNPHKDSLIIPLKLTEQEKLDLVEFLLSLDGGVGTLYHLKHFQCRNMTGGNNNGTQYWNI